MTVASDCDLIHALERQWCDALCARDVAKLSELVHPRFKLIGTRSSGPFELGRDEWLEAIERRKVRAIDLQIRDATVLPQVMIGTVRAKWRLEYLGREIEDCVILTDVWVLEKDRWQVLRRHSTPASASDCAS